MKKLVVLLAAHLIFAKGAVVELDAAEADRLIAEGKAIAATVDKSVTLRDHAAPPSASASDAVLAKTVETLLAPVVAQVKDLGEKVAQLGAAKPARTKATNNAGDPAAVDPNEGADDDTFVDPYARITGGDVPAAQLGMKLARFIRAQAAAEVFKMPVESVLTKWGNGHMAKQIKAMRERGFDAPVTRANQLGQSTLTDGGALVPEQFTAELIMLLRNVAQVRKAGARIIDMVGGNLTLPKQTSPTSASYIGENQPNNLSKPQLGDLRFSEKIMRVDVVLSNSLIQNAAISADAWVRDDMLRVAALKEDLQALFGKGSAYAPFGVENLLDAAAKFNMTAVDRTAPTLTEAQKELNKIIKAYQQSNYPSPNAAWMMNARMRAFLSSLTTTTGQVVFQNDLDAGKLRGYPVFYTEQIANNLADLAALATSDESRLMFGAWDTLVIAQSSGGAQVNVFPNGTYEDAGTVYSGASRDQTYVRLLLKHDINMRYTNTIIDSSWRPA